MRQLRDTLFVVGQGVLNETTASAFLETCLEHAEGELARSALRESLSDEIELGRMGWTDLAAVSEETRQRESECVLPMAYLNLRQWKVETPYDATHPSTLAAHGAPPATVIHAALVDALRDLIVPGVRALGMATAPSKHGSPPAHRPTAPQSSSSDARSEARGRIYRQHANDAKERQEKGFVGATRQLTSFSGDPNPLLSWRRWRAGDNSWLLFASRQCERCVLAVLAASSLLENEAAGYSAS